MPIDDLRDQPDKEQALELIRQANKSNEGLWKRQDLLVYAQVHATLHLADVIQKANQKEEDK